jgi:plastocyanin
MKKTQHVAILAATVLTAVANAGPATADSDIGRQLTGHYCTNANAMPKPGACIELGFDGQTAQGYTNSNNRVLTIRPGTYWLTVTDNSTFHNFSLARPDGSDTDITGITDAPGAVTVKVELTPGTWVLFCEPHRSMGMYVDIVVGGVGQIANS